MFELLIPVSCLFFLFALVPGRHRTYAAIIAWITIIIVFIGGLPTWIEDSNILYPVMALLSIPFLIITTRLLLKGNDAVMSLTRAAGVAFIIYAPFAFDEEMESTDNSRNSHLSYPPAGVSRISCVVGASKWFQS